MPDRPIIFSGPMVKAILDGRKTMTRRVLKPQPTDVAGLPVGWLWPEGSPFPRITVGRIITAQRLPYHVGDRLWVREAWRTDADAGDVPPREMYPELYPIWFEADRDNCDRHGKLRPSIHMPRWASRLTLTVTEVRVQRLQEISEADAVAEGVEPPRCPDCGYTLADARFHLDHRICGRQPEPLSAIPRFADLWDSVNAKRPGCAWSDDPWVVVVGFTAERWNIDA